MTGFGLAARLNPWGLDAGGPAAQVTVMPEKNLRSGCGATDIDYSLDQARASTVPRGDLARERLVNESQALALMLRHAAPPARRHVRGLARGGMASRLPGTVRTGGQTRVVRNHG